MGGVSFIYPAALLLLLIVPILWAAAILAPRRLAPWRFWSSLTLRTIMLLCLILALAGIQFIRPVENLTTVFVLDGSDSVAPAQRERALAFVNEALAALPPGDQAGVVVFGANALVERAPSDLPALNRLTSVPIATRTNIQDAIQLGLALFPADTRKRLVLLSDGGENSGVARDAARLAAVRGVPLDVVDLPVERGLDALIESLVAPGTAREGQQIGLTASIRSTFVTDGVVRVFVDGVPVGEQPVSLQPGMNELALQVPAGTAGFRRIEVQLDAQGDSEPQNNRAATFTEVQGPPRVLLIATNPDRAANLREALLAAEVRPDVRAPDQVPATLDGLAEYAAIILVDTPANALPRALMEVLPAFVRERGGGFAMIGGEDSFGAGGYRRTPLADVLPVALDPLDTTRQPDVALVMVVDRSGSMEAVDTSGRTKLDLAKEAVYQASLGLSERDQVGLVVFDDAAEWALPLRTLPPAVDIERALSSFNTGGGTNIRAGVQQAADALLSTDAAIKHVILLTDGIADSNYADLIADLRAAGVTISTVAIGGDANPNLEQVAQDGGGRFYRVLQLSDIPRIFLQETVLVVGRDIVEEPLQPQVALPAPVVRDLSALPPLYGYNGVEIKPAARAILVTPDGKPILAQWQYGLGSAVAWTSDLQGRWARDWVGWNEFVRFVGGLADLLQPPRESGLLSLRATTDGARSVVELLAANEQGEPLNDLTLAGRLVDPQNSGNPLRFTQVGPGRYRAIAPTSAPGVYLVQVAASAAGQTLGAATTGLVVSFSLEYGEQRGNPRLLRDLASFTGGRVDPAAAAVFDRPEQRVGAVTEIGLALLWLALLCWPFDIGIRRLMVRRDDFAPVLAQIGLRPRPVLASSGETMVRLQTARRRAVAQRSPRPAAVVPPTERPAEPPPVVRSVKPQGADVRPGVPEPTAETHEEPGRSDVSAQEQYARLLAAKQRARKRRD